MAVEQAVSLADELSTAFDSVEAGSEQNEQITGASSEPSGEPAGEPEESSAEQRARDERGRFAKAAEESKEKAVVDGTGEPAAAATETPAQPVSQAQVDLPPSTWTPEAKAAYATLSPVLKQEMKKREADYQRGIDQYKGLAAHGDAFQKAVQPYMPMIQSEGGDPVAAISSLLNTAYRLRTGSPQERGQLIMAVAQQYGADLSPWQGQRQAPEPGQIDQNALQNYVQQLVAQQTAPLQQYQQSLLTQKQQAEQQAAQQTQTQIEQFRTAVNQQGQPEHVYFDNVRPIMASLIESGSANTLDDAYAMACRAHPEVAKAVAAEQQQRAEAQRLGEAKKKAEDARRAAAGNVYGQGGVGLADTSKLTLRDELSSALEGGHSAI